MRTHCLALVTDAYGGKGGIAQYNRDLFDAMAKAGTRRIHILPRHGDRRLARPPAGVVQWRPSATRLAFALRAIWATLTLKPSIIFCGHLFMAPLAALLAWLSGARLVIQLHGIESWEKPGVGTRCAINAADMVFCVSRYTRYRLLNWSSLTPERAVVAANTMRSIFTPGDRTQARGHFGLDAQVKVILCVGRLDRRERYKGQDRIIAALPGLAADGLDPLFLIAGEGDDRARLEGLVYEAGMGARVRFLGDVDEETLVQLYRAADLFAMPSTGEGFGIVFLEAMACGTPALGFSMGGARDPLDDGMMGYAAGKHDLTQVLRNALVSPARTDLSQQVVRRFGTQAFSHHVMALFARLESLTPANVQ